MQSAERIGVAIVTVAMLTTLVLPGRQTPAIVEKFFTGFGNVLGKATGR